MLGFLNKTIKTFADKRKKKRKAKGGGKGKGKGKKKQKKDVGMLLRQQDEKIEKDRVRGK